MSAINTLRIHNGVVISCRYSVPAYLEQHSLKRLVERAIARSVLDHPVLCAGLANENSEKPVWIQVNKLDLGFHVQWRDVDAVPVEARDKIFREVIQPYIDLPFRDLETRPAWSITVLKPTEDSDWMEVVFAFSHLLGDGVGGKIFHETLLQHLRAEDRKPEDLALKDGVLTVPTWTLASFTPPPEKLIHFTFSPGWTAAHLWRELRPPMFAPKTNKRWMGMCSDKPVTTRWLVFTIGTPEAANILEACRQNKTTLTGLLHALALVSFCALVPENKATMFVGDTPINLRRFARHGTLDPDKMMMSVVSMFSHKFDSVVRDIRRQLTGGNAAADTGSADGLTPIVWEVAADVRKELAQKLQQGTHNDSTGLAKFLSDTLGYFRQEMKKPRKGVWEISNMGVISNESHDVAPLPEREDWSIDQCIFLQSAYGVGAGYDVSLAGVKGGPVTFYCSWGEGPFPDELCLEVSKHIESRLMSLAQHGRFDHDTLGAL